MEKLHAVSDAIFSHLFILVLKKVLLCQSSLHLQYIYFSLIKAADARALKSLGLSTRYSCLCCDFMHVLQQLIAS